MSGPERRLFHRYPRALQFEFEHGGKTLRATTLNTSTGGGLLRTAVCLAAGERVLFVIRTEPGGPMRLGLIGEVVHSLPDGEAAGTGVRWIEARSELGAEPIQSFLEKVLGIAKSQVRRTQATEGRVQWVFSFPDLMTRSMGSDSSGLADLLEPAMPMDAAEEAEAAREIDAREKAERDPSGRGGLVRRLSQIMRKVTQPSMPAVPKVEAPVKGKVLPLPLLIRTTSRKVKGELSKLSRTTLGVASSGPAPKVYERVTVTMPIPEKRRSVEVVITGSVTRVKEDGSFTVRFLKVDEQGHKGIFQDSLDHVVGQDGDGEDD